MPHRRTTFSKFIIENVRKNARDPELAALLNDVMTACKLISVAISRGATETIRTGLATPEARKPLGELAGEIIRNVCEFGGQLCGMVLGQGASPYQIPPGVPRGRYLLLAAPLDNDANIDVNMPAGTIFSVLRTVDGATDPTLADYLQPGTAQVAAGYALHGPTAILVVTLGDGTHGFTLEREIGAYMLTHPDMRIPEETTAFAIDSSNAKLWEPPLRRYVEECAQGAGDAGVGEYQMRWMSSVVAEVHRILVRGGVFIEPGGVCLPYVANPLAMLVEHAGGAASTGRHRVLDLQPAGIHQSVPVILGSRQEVDRLAAYHAAYDRGDPLAFPSPLFSNRSLFRTV